MIEKIIICFIFFWVTMCCGFITVLSLRDGERLGSLIMLVAIDPVIILTDLFLLHELFGLFPGL